MQGIVKLPLFNLKAGEKKQENGRGNTGHNGIQSSEPQIPSRKILYPTIVSAISRI